MNTRTYTAIAMSCLCSILFWINTSSIATSLTVIIISLAGIKFHLKLNFRPFYISLGYLAVAVLFAFKINREIFSGNNVSVLFTNVCQYILLVMVAAIILRRSNNIPSWFALYAFIIMILLDKIEPSSSSLEKFCIFSIAALAVIFWFIPENRAHHIGDNRVKNLLTLTVITISCSVGWTQASTLYKYYRVGFAFFSYSAAASIPGENQASQLGFSIGGKNIASSINTDNAEQIVMQVFSRTCPSYLRGKEFDSYIRGTWSSQQRYNLLLPDEKYQDGKSSQNVFLLDTSSAEKEGDIFEVHALEHFDGAIMRTQNTIAVSINAGSLLISNVKDILCNNGKNNKYTLFCSKSKKPKELSEETLKPYLRVLPLLRQQIDNIAQRIFRKGDTTASKIAAVQDFWKNCDYSLSHKVPLNVEPVVYMINNKPPAHCELYASATCILLRLAGVPTKYVTGFIADNYVDNCWIIKNKDSHAWTEAWNKETGQWEIVDVTMVLRNSNPSTAFAHNSKLTIRQRLAIAFRKDGIPGALKLTGKMIADAYKTITAAPLYMVTVLIIVAAAIYVLLYKKITAARKLTDSDKAINKIHRQMRKMDKLLAKRHLTRKSSETAMQFAERIECDGPVYAGRNKHIKWYRDFSKLRYGRCP